MHDSLPLDPDRLLEQSAWVRRLAGRILRNDAEADDASQETLTVALRSGPRDATRARAWLAGVVRAVARNMRRGEARRDVRERAAARPEPTASTAEIVERAALLRSVVDAVLALPEPYRTTILLRHFDELATSEIAARRGEPFETVRTRLKRGLAMLRERLAKDLDIGTVDGARRKGLEALLLLVEPARAGSTAAVITGGALMTATGKMGLLAVLVVATAATTWTIARRHDDASVVAQERPVGASPSAADAPAEVPRVEIAVAPASRENATPAADAPVSLAAAAKPAIDARFSDLTKETWQDLVREDDGPRIRSMVAGLEAESLDLLDLAHYIDETIDGSFVVPGAGESTATGGSKESASAIVVHLDSEGERSVWLPVWGHQGDSEYANVLIPIPFWARENANRLELPSDRLNPFFTVSLRRASSGRMSGNVIFNAGPRGIGDGGMRELEANVAKVKRLEEQGRMPSNLQFQFTGSTGRRTWSRSGAGQDLTAVERERLTALFETVKRLCRDAANPDAK